MAGAPPEGRYRAFYPPVSVTTAQLRQGGQPAVVRPRHRARALRDHDHPARPVRGLSDAADRAPDPEPRHAGAGRHLGHARSRCISPWARARMSRARSRTRCTGRCATSSTCPTSTPPTTTSSTARRGSAPDGARPLAPFTAQRIDYSLARLAHYTATSPTHFQNHVLFTNYQFYMDEFVDYARGALADPGSGYEALRRAGQRRDHPRRHAPARRSARQPQMPAYPPDPAEALRASPWSTSASGRRTPRPSPTISRCCARMSG